MPVKPLFDERELLAKVAAGDQRAFKLLYEVYKKKIYTYSAGLLHSDILAEEVMQEVFLKIWRMGEGLTAIDNFPAFIKTMARNRSLDAMRKLVASAKAEQLLTQNYAEAHNETEETILLNETRKLLEAAINLLPRQQKEVYLLCQQDGLRYEDVADKLDISINTVKTHMKRALSFLRTHVASNSDIAAILIILKII
ncbi:sigma-70 family RNA polymerase sigma factor [Mucilaginibacter sp. BJC16-A38]|uniref:RNA polymerase sigma factor n=1 Tax=Mucilaginibacter phenanthrenivorans TaxID=1234842 RepID=UPI002157555E|nr:sigma-70 family RNA polymerase sigma factor [Mucilaginibacter phenanthrenivorans]MCR8556935.1 sigma-70 family RNA polymerase sigma factor [Mucilaginibacter phenanthrenivorans]